MASRSTSLAPAPRRERQPRPGREAAGQLETARPELDVVDPRAVVERSRRRQARVLLTLAALCVAGPLVLAALGRAIVASDQVRSDSLQSQIAQALQVQQDYQLQKAELVAPARVLGIAETRLHMVTPAHVTYLRPVNPGESVAQAHRSGGSLGGNASSSGRLHGGSGAANTTP